MGLIKDFFENLDEEVQKLSLDTEAKSNLFVINCMIVIAIFGTICEFLNEIHVFIVSELPMRIGWICILVFFMGPVLFYWLSKDKKSLLKKRWLKYVLVSFTYLGTLILCVTLTHHAVLAMVIPVLIVGQYQDSKNLIPISIFFSTLIVFLSVYLGYFIGFFDANLIEEKFTQEIAMDLALRRRLGTSKRMLELFIYYAMPRELIMISLLLLTFGITRRNDEFINKQIEMQNNIESKMKKINEIQWSIIDGMANLIENRDSNTGEHVKRTSYYVQLICNELRKSEKYENSLNDGFLENIVKAAPLHDVGKIVVPDSILQKPGRLTKEEFETIKKHTTEGKNVIKNVLGDVENNDFLDIASNIAYYHHEKYDGSGYPEHLSGTDIPLEGRIMAVADVFDALVSKRIYKDAMGIDEAYNIIKEESGHHFDPDIAEAFLKQKETIKGYLQ